MKKLLFAVIAFLPTLALANSGPYIQGQLGPGGPLPGAAMSLDGGYLWGNNNFNYGLEAGITGNSGSDTGFFGVDTFTSGGYGLNLLGIVKYTFNCGFVTLAKLGVVYLNETLTDSYAGYSASGTGSAVGPQASLGIGYQFNPNWELDFTADAAALTQINAPAGQGNNTLYNGDLLVGLTYHFA